MSANNEHIEMARISAMLRQVGELDGIPGLVLSPQGTARLLLSTGKEVLFEYCPLSETFFAYVPLWPLPADPERRAAVMHGLLASNFLQGCGAGEFALTAAHMVVFQVAMPLESLSVTVIDQHIECLVDMDMSPNDFMRRGEAAAGPGRTGAPPSSGSMQQQLVRLQRTRHIQAH